MRLPTICTSRMPVFWVLALFAGWAIAVLLSADVAGAQPQEPAAQTQGGDAGAASQAREPPEEPDFVVRGRRLGELRLELRRAEDAVYARFNDINSDDRFDMRCKQETREGSHIKQRRCQSNGWRELDGKIATAFLHGTKGEIALYVAEQRRLQSLMQDEMLRLALQDEGLHEAVMQLGNRQAEYHAAMGRERALTRERELTAVDGRLPFGAQRVFEVKMGRDPWSQALTQRTFTIKLFSGEISKIDVVCDGRREGLDFADDVEWTLPDDWSGCILSVGAKKDTTFALYQF